MADQEVTITMVLRDLLSGPLKGVSTQFTAIRASIDRIGAAAAPLTSRITALAAGFGALATANKALNEARSQAQADQRLASALQGNIELFKQITEAAADFQKQTTIGDEIFIDQAAQLAASLRGTTFDMEKLGVATRATFQAAAALGKDANTVAQQLIGTVTQGTAEGRLAKLLPGIEQLDEATLRAGGAFDLLNRKFAGTQEALARTPFGRVTVEVNRLGDAFLEPLGNALAAINGTILPSVVDKFEALGRAIQSSEFAGFLTVMGGIIRAAVELAPTLLKVIGAFAAVRATLSAWRLLVTIFGALASPLGLAIAGIAGLAIAMGEVPASIQEAATAFGELLSMVGDGTITVSEFFAAFSGGFAQVTVPVLAFMDNMTVDLQLIGTFLLALITRFRNAFVGVVAGLETLFLELMRLIANGIDTLSASLSDLLAKIPGFESAAQTIRTSLAQGVPTGSTAIDDALKQSIADQEFLDKKLAELDARRDEGLKPGGRFTFEGISAEIEKQENAAAQRIAESRSKRVDKERSEQRTKTAEDNADRLRAEQELQQQLAEVQLNVNRDAQERITDQRVADLDQMYSLELISAAEFLKQKSALELQQNDSTIAAIRASRDKLQADISALPPGDPKRLDALGRQIALERELQKAQIDRAEIERNQSKDRIQVAQTEAARAGDGIGSIGAVGGDLRAAAGRGDITFSQQQQQMEAMATSIKARAEEARQSIRSLLGDPQYAGLAQSLIDQLDRVERDGLDQLRPPPTVGQGIVSSVNSFHEQNQPGVAAANVTGEALDGLKTTMGGVVTQLILGRGDTKKALQQLGITLLQGLVTSFIGVLMSILISGLLGLFGIVLAPLTAILLPWSIAALVVKPLVFGTGFLFGKEGGYLSGPSHAGGGINLNAEGGEFLHPVAAVDYYGTGIMEAMRRRIIPREVILGQMSGPLPEPSPNVTRFFAEGGLVPQGSQGSGMGGGGTTVLPVLITDQGGADRITASGSRGVVQAIGQHASEINAILGR